MFPEVGDMFIFPAALKHWVIPFKSDVVRVSVSGNVDRVNKWETKPFENKGEK